jgi:hypothetical protein
MAFMTSALIGLLYVALQCAIVVLIAFCILWLLRWFGVAVDAAVLKWGKIVVALICIIIIVSFLFSLLGGAVYRPFWYGR